MPPIVDFGSPVQRGKDENESFWHIPIRCKSRLWNRIGPATLTMCRVYLDCYDQNKLTQSIRLCWGDTTFEQAKEEVLLSKRVVLVPVAWRSEATEDRNGYFSDSRLLKKGTKAWPISSDREKHKFRLRVQSREIKDQSSGHFYLVRCPKGRSNGHFTVEIQYEGEGTR